MYRTLVVGVIILIAIAGCGKHAEHDGHEHEEVAHADHGKESAVHSDEGGDHGHEDEAPGEVHHEDEEGEHQDEIALTPEAIKLAGITLAKVGRGRISSTLDLSGEIGFNEDRLVHVTPRFPGIAQEARFKVGEYVKEGDVVAIIESNESMTTYSLRASLSGRIIQKHITPGEHVSEEESVYILADLSTVWVNLAVYPKDASKVKAGQNVVIEAVGSDHRTEGKIGYVTPVMDPETRRVTARVLLNNQDGQWRPGSFVSARLELGDGEEGIVVDKDALQVLGEKNVIFVQHEPNRFVPKEVVVGETNARQVRILSGIDAGLEYANKGAFELKAKIVTSSLGGHAGHGH